MNGTGHLPSLPIASSQPRPARASRTFSHVICVCMRASERARARAKRSSLVCVEDQPISEWFSFPFFPLKKNKNLLKTRIRFQLQVPSVSSIPRPKGRGMKRDGQPNGFQGGGSQSGTTGIDRIFGRPGLSENADIYIFFFWIMDFSRFSGKLRHTGRKGRTGIGRWMEQSEQRAGI